MNYGALIKDAVWITWRNRFLWVFGFLLSGGQVFSLLRNANNLSQQGALSFLGYDIPLLIIQARQLVLDNLIPFLVLAAVLVLAGIFLSLTSQGALVDSVAALDRGEERNFSSAFRVGLSNFWRILGFSILLLLIFVVLFIPILFLVGLPVVSIVVRSVNFDGAGNTLAGIAIAVLAFLLFIGMILLISILLGIIFWFGLQTLVLDREGVFGSFGRGYRLLVRRPGQVLLVAIIAFALSLGLSIALLILALLLGLLLAVPALILFAADLSTAGTVAGVLAGAILLTVYIVAASAVTAFNHAYWTSPTSGSSPRPKQPPSRKRSSTPGDPVGGKMPGALAHLEQ